MEMKAAGTWGTAAMASGARLRAADSREQRDPSPPVACAARLSLPPSERSCSAALPAAASGAPLVSLSPSLLAPALKPTLM